MKNNELLTLTEMCARLNVEKSWLYSRTMQKGEGAIPVIRVGKYLRFKPDEVMAWIEKNYGETH